MVEHLFPHYWPHVEFSMEKTLHPKPMAPGAACPQEFPQGDYYSAVMFIVRYQAFASACTELFHQQRVIRSSDS